MKRQTAKVMVAAVVALGACEAPGEAASPMAFPYQDGGAPKADVFGRSLVGVASPYEPDPALADPEVAGELDRNVRVRRDQAWRTVFEVVEPVPLLGLAEAAEQHEEIELPGGQVPEVPRFSTWYGVDELKRMFGALYGDLTPAQRRARAPFTADAIDAIQVWNADALDRSDRWPLERYLDHVDALEHCPEGFTAEQCALAKQSKFSGAAGGVARIAYSPDTITHVLGSYGSILGCLDQLDTMGFEAEPENPANFTACFDAEFPPGAVLVKAQWSRVGFGRELPTFDTTGEALRARLGEGSSADWGEVGDRQRDPGPEEIVTIELRNGTVFRLTGLHIMTKELRHWQWVTLWWSDTPQQDFGADRPESFGDLPPVWQNYKMCAVTAFDEADPDPAARYGDMPTLADALAATHEGEGSPTWCSNPYIEHGRGNAATNCVGCHQHGGSTVGLDWDDDGMLDAFDLEEVIDDEVRFPAHGRTQQRELFPTDYLWSFSRIDDFAHVIRAEVEHYDHEDGAELEARIETILGRTASPQLGQLVFEQRCTGCHGEDGGGSGFAPSLLQRVPSRDDRTLLTSILLGRNEMPAWGETLGDTELADLFGFLRDTFGAHEP